MNGEKICYFAVYIVEAVIAHFYMENIFARKRNFSFIVKSTGFGYFLLYFVSLLDITALNTFAFFLVNYALLWTNYHCAFKTAVLHSAFLSFIMTIAEVLIALLMSFFVNDFAAYTYDFTVMVVMAILSKIMYLVFALIGAKAFSPHKHQPDEPRMMMLFCTLPLISAIVSVVIVYIGLNLPLSKAAEIMMLINVLALLVVNLIFLMLYNHMQKTNAENLALQLSIQKDEADAEYYHALQEQSSIQRILIHDIKNHLRTIEGLAARDNTAEIISYINKLEITLTPPSQSRVCDDPILNTLLCRFSKECRLRGIDIQFDIRDNCTGFLDAPSITALYGNLLTNALEAATTSNDKSIELSAIRNSEQSTILISVINSCDNAPVPDDFGKFRSSKHIGFHGIGLKSIERIVQKYNGISTMYYDEEERRFHHIIRFSSMN